MSIVGKYKHTKNENIDEYFAAIGVPYLARKMMSMSSPTMEISKKDDQWSIKNSSMMRTTEITFKLSEEYDENMPTAVLKSITKLVNDDELLTESVVAESGVQTERRYTFTEQGCIVTLTHKSCQNPAKRFYDRIKE